MPTGSRRSVLRLCGAAVCSLVAGCQAPDDDEPTPDPSPTPTSTTTPTASSSPTITPGATPDDLLPTDGDGWTLERTDEYDWGTIGGADGVRGYYTDAEGVECQVIVMRMSAGIEPGGTARLWKCEVGWTVTLAYETFAIAAGTGTVQRTFTPEQPPSMDRTPVPNTAENVKRLLANSPELTRALIDEREISPEVC
jgi:hypothetical protein